MTETIWGKGSFEERRTYYIDLLKKSTIGFVYEMARCRPGSEFDFPDAPIDPALNAAAQQLLRESDLMETLAHLKYQ